MQISYMFSPVGGEAGRPGRSATERNMAGQTAGLRASPGVVPSGRHAWRARPRVQPARPGQRGRAGAAGALNV